MKSASIGNESTFQQSSFIGMANFNNYYWINAEISAFVKMTLSANVYFNLNNQQLIKINIWFFHTHFWLQGSPKLIKFNETVKLSNK